MPEKSSISPAEGARYLAVPNIAMIKYGGKPLVEDYKRYANSFKSLKSVVWSIVGAGGQTSEQEISNVLDLARENENISGVMMDDFFKSDEAGGKIRFENGRIAAYTPEELEEIRKRLVLRDRRLDLWGVVYDRQFNDGDVAPVLGEYLDKFDVLSFWTWRADRLGDLEGNFKMLEKTAPGKKMVLGCYMWDYGNKRAMPIELMKEQCEIGRELISQGRLYGMIFLASCICDIGLDAVDWTKRWIKEVGDENIF